MDEFLNHMAAILEVDQLTPTASLKSFPLLDSLGILSIIAMLDTHYRVNISTADILRMNTPEELWKFVQRIKRTETSSIPN